MPFICENEQCVNHIAVPRELGLTVYMVRVGHMEEKSINRYLYRDYRNDSEFYLCGVCHAAVEMVVRSDR